MHRAVFVTSSGKTFLRSCKFGSPKQSEGIQAVLEDLVGFAFSMSLQSGGLAFNITVREVRTAEDMVVERVTRSAERFLRRSANMLSVYAIEDVKTACLSLSTGYP